MSVFLNGKILLHSIDIERYLYYEEKEYQASKKNN